MVLLTIHLNNVFSETNVEFSEQGHWNHLKVKFCLFFIRQKRCQVTQQPNTKS
jgi:hypothetical protein